MDIDNIKNDIEPTKNELTPKMTFGRHKTLVWTLSVLVWVAILTLVFQSWHDYRADELKMAKNASDLASIIARQVSNRVIFSQQLLSGMSDLVDDDLRPNGRQQNGASERIAYLQALYGDLLPGVELAIFDADGKVAAETSGSIRNRVPKLSEQLARVLREKTANMSIEPIRTERGFYLLMSRSHGNPSRTKRFILAVLFPVDIFDRILLMLPIGPNDSAGMYEKSDRGAVSLLARRPRMGTMESGDLVKLLEEKTPGPVAGTFRITSSVDGLRRLGAIRDVHLPLAQKEWGVGVFFDTNSHLSAWFRSTAISSFVILLLMALWWGGIVIGRRLRVERGRLSKATAMFHTLVVSLPVPVVVVDKETGTISISNNALVDVFGSLAAHGEPISRLFKSPADYENLIATDESVNAAMLGRKGELFAMVHSVDFWPHKDEHKNLCLLVFVDITEQYRREQKLRVEATTDPLTGLANRRYFDEVTAAELAIARQTQVPLAILIMDLDHFKRVNDTHGHAVGDQVLVYAAESFRRVLRSGDIAARLGGEEFAALLPGASAKHAMARAERIRKSIAYAPIILDDGLELTQTVSIGVSVFSLEDANDTLQTALERADVALYRAKEAGRNRVESFLESAHGLAARP